MANCAQCGNALAPNNRFCAVCGRAVTGMAAPDVAVRPALGATSGKAIASLICGIFLVILPASIAAVVLGHLSLSEIKKSAGRIQGQGLAIAGLVLGYLGLAFIPLLIIAGIPNLLRARIAGNEASAVSALRVVTTAEINYQQEHPDKGFTCDLGELKSAGKIDSSIARGTKNGYAFSLQNCWAGANAAVEKYQVLARPLRRNQTGRRTFCSDESAVIRTDSSESIERCLQSGQTLE